VTVSICALWNEFDKSTVKSFGDGLVRKDSYHDLKSEDLVDCFPKSIEHITIYRCYETFNYLHSNPFCLEPTHYFAERALIAFANAAAVRLTNLKKVTYCRGHLVVGDTWMIKLRERFSAIGVQFNQERGLFLENEDIQLHPPSFIVGG